MRGGASVVRLLGCSYLIGHVFIVLVLELVLLLYV